MEEGKEKIILFADFTSDIFFMPSFLGQNFLHDTGVIQSIIEKTQELYKATHAHAILEIGPGKGAITKHLRNLPTKFFAVEKDMLMVDYLTQKYVWDDNHILIHEDALQVDVPALLKHHGIAPSQTLVIGNLPYYITSPLVRKFCGGSQAYYAGGIFMIQQEVARKIQYDAYKKSYLWWLCNFAHNVQYWKTVSPNSFSPAPKVHSALVQFIPEQAQGDRATYTRLLELLDHISPYKRKTLRKIRTMLKKKDISVPNLPTQLHPHRLEELGWEEMRQIIKST